MADSLYTSSEPQITSDENPNVTDVKDTNENMNTFYIKSGTTTVKVVEYFTGGQSYSDIIKTALRREFTE